MRASRSSLRRVSSMLRYHNSQGWRVYLLDAVNASVVVKEFLGRDESASEPVAD